MQNRLVRLSKMSRINVLDHENVKNHHVVAPPEHLAPRNGRGMGYTGRVLVSVGIPDLTLSWYRVLLRGISIRPNKQVWPWFGVPVEPWKPHKSKEQTILHRSYTPKFSTLIFSRFKKMKIFGFWGFPENLRFFDFPGFFFSSIRLLIRYGDLGSTFKGYFIVLLLGLPVFLADKLRE